MIITFKSDRGDNYVYPPSHKLWVQLFKRAPEFDELDYIQIGEVIEEVITDYAYEGKQIKYNTEWEEEVVIEDDEERTLTATEYLYKYFDDVFIKEE